MNFNSLGAPLRNTVLVLVVCLSVIVNIIFCAATLSDPLSLYTLLAYVLILGALTLQLESTLVYESDIKDALAANVYPARFRTPLRIAFHAYVLVWLAWWFVSQMFFDAGVVYAHGYVVQLVLVPLLFLTYSYDVPLSLPAKYRRAVVNALLFVTLVALFFPTFGWAPQHAAAWQPALRVLLYFLSIAVHDFSTPANAHVALSTGGGGGSPRSRRLLHQVLNGNEDPNDDAHDPELGDLQERRRLRIQSIIDAHERIDEETARAREFIAESAWILVTPLAIVLLLFPLALFTLLRISARRRYAAHQLHVQREEVKVHSPPPPPPVVPVAAPTPPYAHQMAYGQRAAAVRVAPAQHQQPFHMTVQQPSVPVATNPIVVVPHVTIVPAQAAQQQQQPPAVAAPPMQRQAPATTAGGLKITYY